MARSFLIFALTAAQFGASSEMSLYLCLSCDGSVCIDGGPSTCNCCGSHNDRDSTFSDERFHQHQDEDCHRSPASWQIVDEPCGCTHLQICRVQAPAVVKPATVTTGPHLDPFAAISPDPNGVTWILLNVADWRSGGSPPRSLPLAVRASVVLRC